MKLETSVAAVMSVALLSAAVPDQPPADARSAAARTVAYLRTEVPRWRREHPCYSCHNNLDPALALLALTGLRPVGAFSTAPYSTPDLDAAIERGRASLLRTQNPDGSWPETTRPPNGDSYAQRISTTAWALMALLAPE